MTQRYLFIFKLTDMKHLYKAETRHRIKYPDQIFRILVAIFGAHFVITISQYQSIQELFSLENFLPAMLIGLVFFNVVIKVIYKRSPPAAPGSEIVMENPKEVVAPSHDVVYIYSHNKSYFAISGTGGKSTWQYSMEETIKMLPSDQYLYIRRAYIVKYDNISEILPESSRRYKLVLKFPIDKEVIVSQRKARLLKSILRKK